jgi:hypothetical protein
MMQQGWREFCTGWRDARWSSQVLIPLAPLALGIALAVQISRGQVPAHVVSSFYAGLVGFAAGIAAALLALLFWRQLRVGMKSLPTGARAARESRQLFVGAKGGEVTKGSPRRRRERG